MKSEKEIIHELVEIRYKLQNEELDARSVALLTEQENILLWVLK